MKQKNKVEIECVLNERINKMNVECTLCGGETVQLRHPKIADYYWCQECDYIFKEEKHIISQNAELKIYNMHNNSIDDPRYVNYFKTFIEDAVIKYMSEGRKGLDFGSGPSPVLSKVLENEYGYSMSIYDKFYAPERVYIGEKYDLITTTEVIEHIKDPLEYFKLFNALLKQDGALAIMTQFHPQAEGAFINWHYMRDRSHISFFTLKTMEYIAKKTDFTIVYTDNKRYITMRKKDK